MKKASVILACLLFPLCTPLFPQTSQDPTPSDPETNGQIPGDWILTASGESAYTFTFTYREGMDNGFNNVRYMMVEGDNEISLTLSPSGGSDPAWLNIRKEGESPVQSFMASDTETTSDTFLLPAGYYRLELISTSDMPSPSTTDPLSASTGPDWSVALPPDCEVTVTLNARGLKPPLDGGLNYIVRISSRAPASSLHYGGENTVTSIEYFDGLGRGVETVELGASGTGENDLVYLTEYDPYGRVSKEWLPGTCPVSGAFVTPTVVKSSAISTHGDTHPYSLQTYEASPLDRPSIQTGAGAAWHAAGKGVRQSRLANVENVDTLDCALLTVTQTGDTALAITKVGNYPSGELYALRVEDEDGNVSLTFTDKSDRTILTRQVRREGTSKELLDTYYIYDVYGNLRAVLPPLAADVMAAASAGTSFGGATTPALREYAYLYIYDGYNRPVRHKLPGCGWVYTVYDRVDRVIATQNAEQRAEGDWAFAIPDRLGRTVLTGTLRTLDGAPLAVGALDTVRVLAEFDGAGADYLGYSLRLDGVTATLGGHEILSANYYDGYAFRSLPGFSADALSYRTSGIGAEYLTRYGTDEEPASPFSSLTASSPHHGALTGTATAMLDSDGDMLYSCLYYDKYHRLVQSRSTNSVGGTEEEFIAYNFTDQPVKREHIHTKGTTPITEEYTYTYDHVGRPLTTTHQLNGGVVVTLADNSYDELGRLRTNKRTGNVKLGTTYSYNVRSWTKSIDGTLFTETLHYNDAPSGISPAYNGNISAMNWK
ncbi:MAG: DUF6443 domain-containing protein, partial [Mediterranea sp.]|nr:DUF6443 domain-containing protein [Mediterranea sp.]